jgi:hypothetical protein
MGVLIADVAGFKALAARCALKVLFDRAAVAEVCEHQGRLFDDPAISPAHKRDSNSVKVAPLGGQPVLLARRMLLVAAAFQDFVLDEFAEAIGQDVAGDPEVALEVGEAAHPEEALA